MQKRAPTLGNILVIILFVLSCFGLLMFLWESFGGPLPLKPKGYRFSVAFPRTLALAEQSDVRISGVDVGHVISLNLGERRTHARDDRNRRPVRAGAREHARDHPPEDAARRDLRAADPAGASNGPTSPTAPSSRTARSNVGDARRHPVGVRPEDQPRLRDLAAVARRGDQRPRRTDQRLLRPARTVRRNANKLVTILNSQEGAVRALVHNTGVVFNALASRDHQLEGAIVNGERTFHAAAEASQAWAEAFKRLPAFEHNSTVALKELDKFAAVANPFLDEFRPVERQLSALLRAAEPFAPQFNNFLTVTRAAHQGRQEGPAGRQADPRPDRPGARKLQAGAAQPRSVPAVHRRIRARGAGVLREPHRRLAGESEQQQRCRTKALRSTT